MRPLAIGRFLGIAVLGIGLLSTISGCDEFGAVLDVGSAFTGMPTYESTYYPSYEENYWEESYWEEWTYEEWTY